MWLGILLISKTLKKLEDKKIIKLIPDKNRNIELIPK